MENKTYNGWTNYATWRVNLELLDGVETSIESNLKEYLHLVEDGTISDEDKIDLVHDLSRELKSVVEETMDSYDTDSIVRSYADAFLSDVDYYDIAETKFISISSKLIELALEQTN
jgi:translation initiation factor RLI1